MNPDPVTPPSPVAPAAWRPSWRIVAPTLAAVAVGALLGQFGALALVQLPDAASWIGAAIGAVVAVVLVPLALALAPHWAPAASADFVATVPTAGAQRAVREPQTGAYTQQHFVAAADREWARLRRRGEDAALLMVDIDGFDRLQDDRGPALADAMVVEVTRQAVSTLRPYDLLARFGGGVMVVYLPHTDPMGALDVAERIRERVAAMRLTQDGQIASATVSIGVAAIGEGHAALDAVISDAGGALREAKTAGRNCVRAAPIPPRRGPPSGKAKDDRRRAGPV